ncbi:MAG: anaerobic nitric oxide reductase flavorubredoxin [Clostridia bacterium]|nr:anaerobic nitric oxide reductase flavorubredoxin [Clostridia bacterium]NCC77128.1 anaerobic nitric oxide reductase flavorubredoxin [Clostridia bacterium]
MAKAINPKVTWVGKIDWELDTFHGDEYSTHHGSSYNAYLVRDQKTVLIDTVWKPFDEEFVAQLKKVVDIQTIDAIVMNHNEIDHSGGLAELMREIPNTPIYCTANGEKILRGHYHQDWNYITVKTGDKLNIGDSDLVFIEAPMLHWPDTMFTYMTGENILFSNDGFGQHYATESLFNDLADQGELMTEALKYYANILTPFSSQVTRKIDEILKLGLPVELICPSHGVIWRDHPLEIVKAYQAWAANYQENQITLVYDTMWESTRKMAEAIARGIESADPSVKIKLFNAAHADKNDIISEVFKSKAILVGSPTINGGILHSIAGLLEMMRGLKFRNKKAAAFGSYGWGGESVHQINDALVKGGFSVVTEGIRTNWVPDEDALAACEGFGKEFVDKIKK